MSNLARLALLPLILGLAACGGKSSATDDNGGGASAMGGGGAGTTGGSSNGGGGHVAGAGGSSVCTKYDDEAPVALSVAILNKTDAPIYLGSETTTCNPSPLFEVADARGGQLPSLGGCRASCVDLRTRGQGGCLAACLLPTSIVLEPGQTGFTGWDGLYLVQGSLPAQCAPSASDGGSVSCDMAKRIMPGTYKFSARAGTSVDCSQTSANGSCSACMPNDVGACAIPGSVISGKILTAQATVELNESYGVYGSSADGPAPGGSGDLPAYQAIELVFTNP